MVALRPCLPAKLIKVGADCRDVEDGERNMSASTQKQKIGVQPVLLLCLLLASSICGCDKSTVDATLGCSSVCERHNVEMEKKKVPIVYGMLGRSSYTRSFYNASTNLFPHAQDLVEGGCMVGKARWAFVYSCPSCEKALLKWQAEIGDELWRQSTNSVVQEEKTNNLSH